MLILYIAGMLAGVGFLMLLAVVCVGTGDGGWKPDDDDDEPNSDDSTLDEEPIEVEAD